MENKITISLEDLENMLRQQKSIVIDRLLDTSCMYNKDIKPGQSEFLPIDKEKFKEIGCKSSYPEHFNVLKRYIK